jgi:hypothetical protein
MISGQPTFARMPSTTQEETTRLLDSIAWAVFFIWVGIAMLTDLPWGWFLFGIGILILAMQAVHWQLSGTMQGFWLACGIVFLAGGAWRLLELSFPLTPVLFVMLGLALLGKVIVGVRR